MRGTGVVKKIRIGVACFLFAEKWAKPPPPNGEDRFDGSSASKFDFPPLNFGGVAA